MINIKSYYSVLILSVFVMFVYSLGVRSVLMQRASANSSLQSELVRLELERQSLNEKIALQTALAQAPTIASQYQKISKPVVLTGSTTLAAR